MQPGSNSPPRATGALQVAWLGHSTVSIELDGTRLLTDPLLEANAGVLRRRYPAPPRELWQDPDAVLISHLHHDHAELSSLRLLPPVPILSSPGNAAWIRRRGLNGVDLSDDWNRPIPGSGVELQLTPAIHGHRPMPHRPNEANGQLVRGSRWRVWVVGDTSLFPRMADVPDLLGGPPDLVVIPIAGWGPRLSEGHLDPHDAAEACLRSRARRAIPVHWGTLHPPLMDRMWSDWIERPLPEFRQALARTAPHCELIDLRPGEVWTSGTA